MVMSRVAVHSVCEKRRHTQEGYNFNVRFHGEEEAASMDTERATCATLFSLTGAFWFCVNVGTALINPMGSAALETAANEAIRRIASADDEKGVMTAISVENWVEISLLLSLSSVELICGSADPSSVPFYFKSGASEKCKQPPRPLRFQSEKRRGRARNLCHRNTHARKRYVALNALPCALYP